MISSEEFSDVPVKMTDGINGIPYSEYLNNRDPAFDYIAALRRNRQLIVPSTVDPNTPKVIEAYELAHAGVDAVGVNLWPLVSKAKDLLGLFSGATSFARWYNSSPGDAQQIAVNHPRLQIHREFDDLHIASTNNGIVAMIENQTEHTLVLDAWISWYGWAENVALPAKLEAYETGFLNWTYSGPLWHTAAVGLKYSIGSTGWFAYIAFYTSRLGSNYTRVILTQPSIPWEHLYDSLQRNTSFSKPSNGFCFLNSNINLDYRAKAFVQLGTNENQSLTTSLLYMFEKWRTPKDYKDEL